MMRELSKNDKFVFVIVVQHWIKRFSWNEIHFSQFWFRVFRDFSIIRQLNIVKQNDCVDSQMRMTKSKFFFNKSIIFWRVNKIRRIFNRVFQQMFHAFVANWRILKKWLIFWIIFDRCIERWRIFWMFCMKTLVIMHSKNFMNKYWILRFWIFSKKKPLKTNWNHIEKKLYFAIWNVRTLIVYIVRYCFEA